jgi:hypothetical protein
MAFHPSIDRFDAHFAMATQPIAINPTPTTQPTVIPTIAVTDIPASSPPAWLGLPDVATDSVVVHVPVTDSVAVGVAVTDSVALGVAVTDSVRGDVAVTDSVGGDVAVTDSVAGGVVVGLMDTVGAWLAVVDANGIK